MIEGVAEAGKTDDVEGEARHPLGEVDERRAFGREVVDRGKRGSAVRGTGQRKVFGDVDPFVAQLQGETEPTSVNEATAEGEAARRTL